jgi:hypothetical protein
MNAPVTLTVAYPQETGSKTLVSRQTSLLSCWQS